MATSLFVDLSGTPIPDNEVIGYGGSGVVVRRDNLAIKTPLRHPWSCEEDVQENTKVLQHEQRVYRRFNLYSSDLVDCIVPCSGLCTNAIQLVFMENGDLRAYLEKHKPSRTVQLSWFRQMARALEQTHDKYVLVGDLATRNFLLDSELSIKISDFSEASILPLGTSMEEVDDNGFSIQTDIGLLGAVMYEVITGKKCKFDLFPDDLADSSRATFPQRSSLPSTETLWLGSIIDKCWTPGGFRNAHALSQALKYFDVEQEYLPENKKSSSQHFRDKTKTPVIMGAITFSALVVLTAWARRRA
ncbi:hypothetical protein PISL3812_09915 [Talaromyces islandicus]|uniref:Protein kinase domain-containing protein n=1 Tax=Talaromyces islandicus TaxID=28573 RepID=A0A0U1MB50_TALIS|nr:hypothetical protein PISL3812_09915 [Talaromyces islandicus]